MTGKISGTTSPTSKVHGEDERIYNAGTPATLEGR